MQSEIIVFYLFKSIIKNYTKLEDTQPRRKFALNEITKKVSYKYLMDHLEDIFNSYSASSSRNDRSLRNT